jgi:hypothetical protein
MTELNEESSWLSMLKIELQFIDPSQLIEPDGDLDDRDSSEHELGDASLENKKLWTYFATLEEKATRMLTDARYLRGDIDKRVELVAKASEMRAKAEMARGILFLNLRDKYKIWNPTLGVGIRKGWKVVSFKSNSNPLLDLLKGEL